MFGRKLVGLGVAGALVMLGPVPDAQADPPDEGLLDSERVGVLQRLNKLDRLGLLRPGEQTDSNPATGRSSSPEPAPAESKNVPGADGMVLDPSPPSDSSAPQGGPSNKSDQQTASHPPTGTHPRAGRSLTAPVIRTVTLVTGDRVRLEYGNAPGPEVKVTPGQGREDVTFDIRRDGSQVSVVPSDARRLVRAGRVDPRLFDITGLVQQQYHDGATDQLPLLVESEQGSMVRPPAAPGAKNDIRPLLGPMRLPSVGMAATELSKDELAEFWGPLQTVISDALNETAASLAGSVPAPMKSAANGFADSAGVNGMDGTGPDGAGGVDVHSMDAPLAWRALAIEPRQVGKLWLDGRVRAMGQPADRGAPADAGSDLDDNLRRIGAPTAWSRALTGKGVRVAVLDSGIDRQHPDLAGRVARARDFVGGGTGDSMGHGTHVASVLAGSGKASDGTYRGVAPDAGLFVGRVLDERGAGAESEVIAGMEWAIDQGADVVNVSLGDLGASDGTDPMSKAANRLGKHALIVAAAGNGGPDYRTIGAPGAAERVLTVAAVHDDGETADFSSRGPRRGDSLAKPDIAAPGVNVVGARARGTEAGPVVAHRYVELTGTSMAVPYVSGAAAVLAQAHPDWRPRKLKQTLMDAARSHHDGREQGDGELDLEKVVQRFGSAEQASSKRSNTNGRRRAGGRGQ